MMKNEEELTLSLERLMLTMPPEDFIALCDALGVDPVTFKAFVAEDKKRQEN